LTAKVPSVKLSWNQAYSKPSRIAGVASKKRFASAKSSAVRAVAAALAF
jgi:hypothetical protein